MKKTYSAPDIVFESFSLSVNIASCDVGTNHVKGDCGYEFITDFNIFLEGVGGCNVKIVDGSDDGNGLCYHNPTEDKQLFGS